MRIVNACLCLVGAVVVACGGGGGDKGPTEVASPTLEGKYTLVSIAGHKLPVRAEDENGTITFLAGSLTLHGQQYTLDLTIEEASEPIEFKGPFTRAGNDVSFALSSGDPPTKVDMVLHWDGANQLSPMGDSPPFLFQR